MSLLLKKSWNWKSLLGSSKSTSLHSELLEQQKRINQLIIDNALDAVIAINKEGNILEWTGQATSIFGWHKEEVLGKELGQIIVPEQHRSAHNEGMKRLLASGQSRILNKRIEITGLHKQGHEFPIELSIVQFEDNGQSTFSAFVRDLTEIKKKEEEIKLKERYISETNKSLYELKLHALRSKLNPHFYFNTLNNLYSLALQNAPETPETVLKLSSIMEYILYECDADKVSLEKEIRFLRDYVEIQKLRYPKEVSIVFESTFDPAGLSISPLILIQYVENAFKHGLQSSPSESWMKVELIKDSNYLTFSIENSKSESVYHEGIGLQNARTRLELLYPDKHELHIENDKYRFKVNLRMSL